ncbi:MAG: tRNA adenosine(34) deaminase TadA [Desulfobacteraceae bacterium]|nr:MAG: tRNA adenosine(34) deaminase TadA [Desulfobacteraceae bacterium]
MISDFTAYMHLALEQAHKARQIDEVPIGAVLIDSEGEAIAKAFNQPIRLHDPTAHAEILALREAGRKLENYRLNGLTLVVTIEPCPMCLGAMLNARIARLVFGAPDPKWGAAGSLYDLARDKRLNHQIEVVSGVLADECGGMLKEFFEAKRKKAIM